MYIYIGEKRVEIHWYIDHPRTLLLSEDTLYAPLLALGMCYICEEFLLLGLPIISPKALEKFHIINLPQKLDYFYEFPFR